MAVASRRRVPVLIVGGGPVGLYASSLLSSYGVPSLLVERSAQASTHPRAHLINTRSMELLRELGVEPQVRAQTPPMSEWQHFRYCSTLLGEQIASQDHMAGATWAQLQAASPTEVAHLSQPKLAAILRADATRRATESGASLLCGYECTLLEQDDTGVRAELRRRPGGGGAGAQGEAAPEVVHVEAQDVLGCDGAHSSVRRWLGLPMQGPPPLQHFKSVHFSAPELWPRLRETDRSAMLYFTFNSDAVAVFVAHNLQQGEWVAQLPFFPALEGDDALDKRACEAAIRACIGGAGGGGEVPFSLQSATSWAMRAVVAQRLSAGRVHLMGDAAHQFPPAGAFGANTGLQDAHNLCWKLGALHHRHAGRALLRSYDAERRPVAVANAELSVHNYHRGLRVASALGLPAALPHAAEAAADAAAPVASWLRSALPAPLRRAVSGSGSAMHGVGRRVLIDMLGHAAPHQLGRSRRDAAARVVASGAALPLLFPRHELGFIYEGAGAATAHEAAVGAGNSGGEGGEGARSGGGGGGSGGGGGGGVAARDVEDESLQPSTAAGARMPHHWLRAADGARVSSHELLRPPAAHAAHALALVVDSGGAALWTAALHELSGAWPVHLAEVAPAEGAAAEGAAAEGAFVDPCGGWAEKRQVLPCGALLVRPDGHVAWRCHSLAREGIERPADAAERLDTVLQRILTCEVPGVPAEEAAVV